MRRGDWVSSVRMLCNGPGPGKKEFLDINGGGENGVWLTSIRGFWKWNQ